MKKILSVLIALLLLCTIVMAQPMEKNTIARRYSNNHQRSTGNTGAVKTPWKNRKRVGAEFIKPQFFCFCRNCVKFNACNQSLESIALHRNIFR